MTVADGPNTTVHTCTAKQVGPLVVVRVQLTTTQTGNGSQLAVISGIPRPNEEAYGVLANGNKSLGVLLRPSGTLVVAGGSTDGGSWLGGVLCYLV